jgi:hypothetical protein
MMRRLPSLNARRAFEAAARHLSLTKAAAELHVTPAAISKLGRLALGLSETPTSWKYWFSLRLGPWQNGAVGSAGP